MVMRRSVTDGSGSRQGRTVTAARRVRIDAVSVLTVYLVLLFVVPSNRTIGPLGGAGAPAALFGFVALVWWGWYQVSRTRATVDRGRRPVRIAFFLFCGAALVSYIIAALSPRPQVEVNGADLGLLRLLSYAGVFLIANDGIRTLQRLRVLLQRIVFGGALFATLGIVQFLTKQSFVDAISIPGLSTTQDFSSVQDRSGFARAAATATNPLEYAFVLSMIAPIAITLALDDRSRSALRRWLPAGLIIVALALSASRSGVLGLFFGVLILFITWSNRVRVRALVVAAIGSALVYVLVPGMVGTIRGLFLNIGQDSSAVSRTSSYDVATTFIERNPFFGRGFGTFLPQYRILDNQYLLTAIENGGVGLILLLSLLITAILVVVLVRRRQVNRLQRQIAQALAASIVVGALLMAFFDVFSFRMAVGLLMLLLGICGAYWRLGRESRILADDQHAFWARAPLER